MSIRITLPDKSVRTYEKEITGYELASDIGRNLAKDAICIEIDGTLTDLHQTISSDAKCKIFTQKDQTALEILRHSSAHILAQAVINIYPNTQYGVGPAIEDGFYYDFLFENNISEDDLSSIENEMNNIISKKQTFIKEYTNTEKATELFKDQRFKKELINTADKEEGIDNNEVSIYKNDKFKDLCKGPHIPNTGYLKHFKLTKVAGAYWRGKETNPQLQRIYGTSWFTKDDLNKYLTRQEEAEKRDHRKIGKELKLFTTADELGPGQFLWQPNGAILRNEIESFSKKAHIKNGYDFVNTPHIGRSILWETSGHLSHYKEGMYPALKDDNADDEYYLKPMNCPFHILVYKNDIRSYRELPIRYFELGSVYRMEKTGVLHGLLRARGFTQDDAHIFTTTEDLNNEILNLLTFSIKLLNCFGFENIEADLSTRPEDSIGEDKDWEIATQSLEDALNIQKISYKIAHGEGAFYGPKIDLHVKDAIGRRWQLTTIQIDFAQPDNFSLEYINSDNKKVTPVMIHRALLGSIERFTGILTEHYAGVFPGWLAPTQVNILTIGNVDDYLKTITKKLSTYRINIDDRNIRLGEKIHDSKKLKIPVTLIIGENDAKNNTIAINYIDGIESKDIEISEGMKSIKNILKEPVFKL